MPRANGTRDRRSRGRSDRMPLVVAGGAVAAALVVGALWLGACGPARKGTPAARTGPARPASAPEPEQPRPTDVATPAAPDAATEVPVKPAEEPPATVVDGVAYYETGEEFAGPFPSWRNVRTDFGAVGDGKADDTAAIQKALDEMKTVQTNDWCVLYFPAGTYRITKTLTTSRGAHHDHLGTNLVGEDPATTVLLWDGPPGAPMFRFDAWYCRVARLTFDGRGKANSGLLRAGGFATCCEHSDLVFRDIAGIAVNLGNAEAQGIAETAIMRCRFIRCHEGISTINWNTLDIYVWYCLFEDCGKGIYNRMGGFQAYGNVFLRSKEADLLPGSAVVAVVENASVGSKTFLKDGFGNLYLRGNTILDTVDPVAVSHGGDLVMLDNTIASAPGASGMVVQCGPGTLAVGNAFAKAWPIRPYHNPHPNAATLRADLDRALDGDPGTEFTDVGCNDPGAAPHAVAPLTVQWNAPEGGARRVVRYALTSGSDPGLDPRDLRFESADLPGGPWTVLDERKGLAFAGRRERKEFTVAPPGAHRVYRLTIGANAAGTPRCRVAEVEFLDEEGRNVLRDPACLVTGRNEKWGQFVSLDDARLLGVLGDRGAGAAPPPRLPATPRNLKRKVFEVRPGTGDDAKELQAQVDAAAREPAGGNPIVHVPKGTFRLSRTVTVPALKRIQLVGDGVGNGTILERAGGGGPVLRLAGPSRATLRDLEVRASGPDGAEAIVVENADQEGGRIYAEQLNAGGNGEQRCDAAMHVDGLDRTEVTMTCGGFTSCLSGVRARGGPRAREGRGGSGSVAFLCGGSGSACRLLDVADGGRLVGEAFWYEVDWAFPAALIDLSASSRGTLSAAAIWWHKQKPPKPMVSVNGFDGLCAIVASTLGDKDNGGYVRLEGDCSKATLFCAGTSIQAPLEAAWVDLSRPAARAAMLGCNGVSVTDKTPGAVPDAGLIRKAVEQLRAVRIRPAMDRPEGVTDVKIFRVIVTGGVGRDAVRFQAGAAKASTR